MRYARRFQAENTPFAQPKRRRCSGSCRSDLAVLGWSGCALARWRLAARCRSDEYLSRKEGDYFDLDLLVTGPIVRDMSSAFDQYWNSQPGHRRTAPFDCTQQAAPWRCDAQLFVDPVSKADARAAPGGKASLHDQLIELFLDAEHTIQTVSPYFFRGRSGWA